MYRKAVKPQLPPKPESTTFSRQFPTMALSVEEMAEELRISRPNAYELVKQPGFPAFRLGKRLVINRSALQRWLDVQVNQSLDSSVGVI